MIDDMAIQELHQDEISMVGGAGCRTEIRVRCDSQGNCSGEAVLICEF